MKAVAYDHDQGGFLEQCCRHYPNDIRLVGVDDESTQGSAGTEILKAGEDVVLVHMDNEPQFARVIDGIRQNQVLVRFSTQPLICRGPYGKHRNAFNSRLPVGQLLKEFDKLGALLKHLSNTSTVESLKLGRVPGDIRDILSFREPHTLRALFLLTHASVIRLATDPTSPANRVASDAVGGHRVKTANTTKISRRIFLSALGVDPSALADTLHIEDRLCATRWQICGELGLGDPPDRNATTYQSPPLAAECGIADKLLDEIGKAPFDEEPDPIIVTNAFIALRMQVGGELRGPEAWESSRSRFNHDWLKNRLVVAIGKQVRITKGEVTDREDASASFVKVLNEWPARYTDALLVLEEVSRILPDPYAGDVLPGSPLAGVAIVNWQHWVQSAKPHDKLSAARSSLDSLNNALLGVGSGACLGTGLNIAVERLEEIRIKSLALAKAFSDLSVPAFPSTSLPNPSSP